MAAYRDALDRFRAVFRIEPVLVAHDLHPDFMTTRFAESLGLPRVAVQHHHAHIAATMAEHRLEGDVLGLAFDGLGLGDDGTIWGGELLVCDAARSRRVGHLRQVVQPGGDAATRDPVRMALAHAHDAGVLDERSIASRSRRARGAWSSGRSRPASRSPRTSSAGRLFDAVAAIAGVCRRPQLRGAARDAPRAGGARRRQRRAIAPVVTRLPDGLLELDTRPLILDALRAGRRRRAVPRGPRGADRERPR